MVSDDSPCFALSSISLRSLAYKRLIYGLGFSGFDDAMADLYEYLDVLTKHFSGVDVEHLLTMVIPASQRIQVL